MYDLGPAVRDGTPFSVSLMGPVVPGGSAVSAIGSAKARGSTRHKQGRTSTRCSAYLRSGQVTSARLA